MKPIIITTQDGNLIARCPRTGIDASGATKESATAELRRKIEGRGK